jgi:Protein of unknown function (DUF3306)
MEHTERDRGFLARWSERKQIARQGAKLPADPPIETTEPEAAKPSAEQPPEPVLTDADMPPLDSLDGRSDYSGFLSRGVSAALRRQALTQLFHSPHLNVTDGLDDFAEDYTAFQSMGDLITADMRHQAEVAARRLARCATDAAEEAGGDTGAAEPVEASAAPAREMERPAAAERSHPQVAVLPDPESEQPTAAPTQRDQT